MLGVFSSFTSFLGHPFLPWSPYSMFMCRSWLLSHVYDRMILDGVKPEKDDGNNLNAEDVAPLKLAYLTTQNMGYSCFCNQRSGLCWFSCYTTPS
ncbi:hypothetical protein HanPI659440_Chr15g0594261 [Helianthus annuus]|nr:hypothetical protein HanPI659440_Chr15g0594261 [Helianthus annuus]